MERETGFEPATPSLEGLRSSQLSYSRMVFRISDCNFLIVNPRSTVTNPRLTIKWWGGEVSNLRRLTPTDLQSVPFGHSGTSPMDTTNPGVLVNECMKSGATEGNRTPDRLITNQLLYQLSYGGRTFCTHHALPDFINLISYRKIAN